MTFVVGLLGILILAAVISDAFEAMLLPRRVRRALRFIRLFFIATWRLWQWLGRIFQQSKIQDGFLSLYGPLSMVGLLACWGFGLIVGFGLLQWSIEQGRPNSPSLITALYFSGASLFTVGYGDVLPLTPLAKVLAVIEAGTGLGFIAVTIGYLPVLYQLFSRREANVIKLDARAGSPPSATALLCRHAENEAMDELAEWLPGWEQWCAELVESHLSYPMLSYYRSQHDNQSWLGAVTALMDSCALLLTGFRGVRTFSARMTFAMARLATVELCRVFQVKLLTGEPDRLPPEQFTEMQNSLADAGLVFSDEGSAEERLAAFRATYEPFLFALSHHFLLRLPTWLPEDSPDNWHRSFRGKTAKQLVEASPVQPE